MKKQVKRFSEKLRKLYYKPFTFVSKDDGFGRDEILGTAAVLIIAAFITIPQLKSFVSTLVTALNSWWSTTVSSKIFPTS